MNTRLMRVSQRGRKAARFPVPATEKNSSQGPSTRTESGHRLTPHRHMKVTEVGVTSLNTVGAPDHSHCDRRGPSSLGQGKPAEEVPPTKRFLQEVSFGFSLGIMKTMWLLRPCTFRVALSRNCS